MILFFTGIALIIVGAARVLIEAGRNWSRWRGEMRERNTDGKGKLSLTGIILIAVGAALTLASTSISPLPPAKPLPPPQQQVQ